MDLLPLVRYHEGYYYLRKTQAIAYERITSIRRNYKRKLHKKSPVSDPLDFLFENQLHVTASK